MPTIKRCAALLLGVSAAFTTFPAASAEAAAGTSSPVYSDPVWWPLRDKIKVDCTHHNNCAQPHAFWGVDVIPWNQTRHTTTPSHDAVYAMGAGMVHIGDAHGKTCGTGTSTDFGTWVWVDHGGGVVSKYGHLGSIDVHEGQQVFPQTKLGTVGNTGNASKPDCAMNYVDFQVRHGGVNGSTVEFSTSDVGAPDGDLLMCTASGTTRVTDAVKSHWAASPWTRIDQFGQQTPIDANTADCIPAAARTHKPSTATLTRSRHTLVAAWAAAPAGVNGVRVEFARYHPSNKAWDTPQKESWRDLGAGATSAKFSKLTSGHKYRMRLWFHTAQGWSSPSGWATATSK